MGILVENGVYPLSGHRLAGRAQHRPDQCDHRESGRHRRPHCSRQSGPQKPMLFEPLFDKASKQVPPPRKGQFEIGA